jgi:predicted enzyme related to lactoylglutathione lyase
MAEYPEIPTGSGKHPIPFIAIAANDVAGSTAFYARIFGWQTHAVTSDVTDAAPPAGPSVSLRAKTPDGSPGLVPFIGASDVHALLDRIVAGGGTIEHPPSSVPMAGTLARFADPSGTIYGLTGGVAGRLAPIPLPFGSKPKPPAGTICSIEMYSKDHTVTARFFNELFEWGTRQTMPQYLGFNPGAGVSGVFQSHTPSLPAVAYVYVADVAATLQEIEAAGGTRTTDPMSVPGMGTFGYFTDPSGTSMGLIGPDGTRL